MILFSVKRLLVILLLLPAHAWAALLFDNGLPVEADLGMRYNYAQYTIYDDFTISDRSVITGLGWSQYDEEQLTYIGTTVSFFSVLGTAPLISFDVAASRIDNGLNGVPFPGKANGPVTGIDYFAFLGFFLNPGTYFVGIHNDVAGGQTLMANTLGTNQSIPGSYQSISSNVDPVRFESNNADFAFQIFGEVAVPEPSTFGLLGVGLLGLGFIRRRRAA